MSKLSRRAVIYTGAALTAGAFAGRAQAQQKVSQDVAQYQPEPKDGQRCDGCLHWEEPNACALVEGEIAPEAWCALFAPAA